MKSYDYAAMVYDSEVYCVGCIQKVSVVDDAILVDEGTCCECGTKHGWESLDLMSYKSKPYCVDCLPMVLPETAHPIFAGDELDHAPVCAKCGEVHDYMSIIGSDE